MAGAWSHDVASIPAQRPPKALARCATTSGENRKLAAPARAAKKAAADANERSQTKVAVMRPPDSASADFNARAIRQVTAAAAVAERVTAATVVPGPAVEKTAPVSTNNTGPLVVLLIARPEIRSVSDLTGKNIAIDDRQFADKDNVRLAIAGAGATKIKLSDGRTKAIRRLMSERVPAAVLALVSPDAAEGFPEIAGFKIFRIPLPRR